jgi:preprotein translocase subunit YajC
MMLLMFAVFYFILIRPQVKKQREHQALLNKLEKGDMIITRGGLVGKISGITDTVLTVELQEKVRVRVLRAYVDGKYDPAQMGRKAGSDKKAA